MAKAETLHELTTTAGHFPSRPDSTVVGVTLGTIREAAKVLDHQQAIADKIRLAITYIEDGARHTGVERLNEALAMLPEAIPVDHD